MAKRHKSLINKLRFAEPFYSALGLWRAMNYVPANLSNEQRRIVAEVKEKGFAISHVSKFGLELPLQFLDYVGTQQKGKDFLFSLPDHKHFFWSLTVNPVFTSIVGEYLRTVPKCLVVLLERTAVSKEPPKMSQLWHRDGQDRKMLNFFIYLKDVDEGTGPFTYIQYSKTKYAHVAPQVFPASARISDDLVRKHVDPQDIKPLTGKAGTIIFADTTGIHRGAYATKSERFCFSVSYTTHVSLWPQATNI